VLTIPDILIVFAADNASDSLFVSLSTMPNKKGKRKAKAAAQKSVSVADANLALWYASANGIVSLNRVGGPMSVQAAIAAGADVNYSR
jgi:hypothetical protein